jgi:hypothetical protein
MSWYFTIAAFLLFAIGSAHSWLGEKFILIPLFGRGKLPHLLGSDLLTKRTLRFAWHLTTAAWWGIAAILLVLSSDASVSSIRTVTKVIAVTFLTSAVVAFCGSRGRHLSWIVFLAVGLLTWAGANT